MPHHRGDIKAANDAYEAALQNNTQISPSIRRIAEQHDVSHATLARRINGTSSPHKVAHTHQQVIKPIEEDALVDFIARHASMGHPPPPSMIIELADHLRRNRLSIESNHDELHNHIEPLGKHWIEKFRERHPQVATSWSRQLDRQRMEGTSKEVLEKWFREYKETLDKNGYEDRYIFNMDETGYAVGASRSTRVMTVVEKWVDGQGRRSAAELWKLHAGKQGQEWVSTLECVSGANTSLPPLVVFKADGPFHSHWRPQDNQLQEWGFITSQNGWSNNFISTLWLKRHFVPLTNPPDPNQRRLLIVDGHGSHMTPQFVAICIANCIDLLVLPSHTSHITQPLDVGPFSTLKAELVHSVDKIAQYNPGTIAKATWLAALAAARENTMTERYIRTGWKKTGLIPFDPSQVKPPTKHQSQATPGHTPLARTPLSSLSSQNSEFMRENGQNLELGIKNHCNSLALAGDLANTRSEVLEKENVELRKVVESKKRTRAGITVGNLNTSKISEIEPFQEIVEYNANRKANRKKKKEQEASLDS